MSRFAITFTYFRPLQRCAWLIPPFDYACPWRGLTYLAFLFLVLGMTGHDDMVACAHNVSLRSTSVIWGRHGWLRPSGCGVFRPHHLHRLSDSFVVACPFSVHFDARWHTLLNHILLSYLARIQRGTKRSFWVSCTPISLSRQHDEYDNGSAE